MGVGVDGGEGVALVARQLAAALHVSEDVACEVLTRSDRPGKRNQLVIGRKGCSPPRVDGRRSLMLL
jgi:hypothetical protein